MGKSHHKWQISIAMLIYQSVCGDSASITHLVILLRFAAVKIQEFKIYFGSSRTQGNMHRCFVRTIKSQLECGPKRDHLLPNSSAHGGFASEVAQYYKLRPHSCQASISSLMANKHIHLLLLLIFNIYTYMYTYIYIYQYIKTFMQRIAWPSN